MTRPYTGYIEEKQKRLNSAINELLEGPDNDFNMRYALRAIEELAQSIRKEAQLKQKNIIDRLVSQCDASGREDRADDYAAERDELIERMR